LGGQEEKQVRCIAHIRGFCITDQIHRPAPRKMSSLRILRMTRTKLEMAP
jgi:hypothetical protein